MKNKLNLAALIAIGLVAVSCSTDTVDNESSAQKQNYELNAKKTDSIAKATILPSIYVTEDGTIPPIKP